MTALGSRDVVALFDSATVLHGALAAALRGEPFPHLGNGPLAAAAVRVGGRLPWALVRRVYTRVGAAEGIDPDRLGEVDLAAVTDWLVDGYPRRRYPAALVGSSNGALAHPAPAPPGPWLPRTPPGAGGPRGGPPRPGGAPP